MNKKPTHWTIEGETVEFSHRQMERWREEFSREPDESSLKDVLEWLEGEDAEESLVWYDLDPQASELWVVEGPAGWDVEELDPDNLPDGFRWVTAQEWEERHEEMEIVE